MKIREITIKNFKSIIALHMDNIPDLVVIAGPNGCGKTSIFDAIRIFKAIVGPYNTSELSQIQNRELRNELRNTVNLKAEFAEITLGIEPSETEKNYLLPRFPNLEETLSQNQGLLISSVKILKTGQPSTSIASAPLADLLRHYDPTDEIGTFEYIPSYREVPMGEPGRITLSAPALDQEKLERTANVKEKFARLKLYLIMMFIYDKMELSDQASKFMPDIKDFFSNFFFPKEFEGIKVDKSLRWDFPIKTPHGIHDMDFLSSGEKEILGTFTNILKMKLTGSVILFDEPELHLNAALERKVIGSLTTISNAGNQVWLATHSFEIVGTVPLENLYKMYLSFPEGGDNQIDICSSKKDLVETLELLGASIGIQLISQKIVFVEGKTDKDILKSLFEKFSSIVSFVETKGLGSLMGVSQAAIDLLDQVSKDEPYYMIRDRDFLSDAKVEEIKSKYVGKVFIWNFRTIENYLLDPKILIDVLNQLGIDIFDDEESVLIALKNIADDLKIETIADMIVDEMQKRILDVGFGLPSVNTEENLLKLFIEIGEKKASRLNEQFSDASLKKLYDEKKGVVDSVWDGDSLKICNGEKALKKFIELYIKPDGPKIDIIAFRRLIINQMKSMNAIPEEIEDIIVNQIIRPNAGGL